MKAGAAPSCFVIPLLARRGGLLVMVPDEFLDPNLLLDAMQGEEEGMIGPSKDFVSALVEEDDEGRPVPLGRSCNVMVLDLSDESLLGMANYDPVTHDYDACVSFDSARPAALPAVTDVLGDIKLWIEGVTENRLHFYSAREEPEVQVKAPAKKGPATKKITNHAIMENLTALQNQLQALQAQQDAMRRNQATSSAIPAAVPAGPLAATSKMPGVSAGMLAPTGVLSGIAKLVGPPPKAKAPNVPDVVEEGVTGGDGGGANPTDSISDPMVRAITQQSQALTALVAHLAGGDPLSELQGSGAAAGGEFEFQRRRTARKNADGSGESPVQLFPPSAAAVVQTHVSQLAGAKDRVGAHRLWSYNDILYGEAGRLQEQQRPCPMPVDSCPCDGFGNEWGRAWLQRVFGLTL